MLAALRPGAVHFAACFAAGALLGPPRVLLLEPAIGAAASVAVEAPLILAVAYLSARWVRGRHPDTSPVAIGAVALALLVLAETALAAALGRPSPLALPAGAADWIGLALKGGFALIPCLIGRRDGGVMRGGEPGAAPPAQAQRKV
ncbi:MAG: hypothetical protein SNJ73_03200 [Acetobacteraceae bacterium]